jgi:hypothetical protein
MFTTCETEPDDPDFTSGTVITLSADVDADGVINSSNGEQWFKFTANADTQYITITYGSMTSVNFQIYNNDGNGVTNGSGSKSPPYTATIFTCSLSRGQVYYLEVTSSYSGSGTYRIRFSAAQLSPERRTNAITLIANTWTDGDILDEDQTYKFTATASTQYIHIKFGSLTDLYIRFYDKDGIIMGGSSNDVHLTGSTNTQKSTSQFVTNGQVYYIIVFASETRSGDYHIAFTATSLAPQ